ncbi:unnamed protein product [Ceutorhynchus assimilis]|uniref:Uncharacterized protein n=1 Tax=Ceutorhynchus assimilis TaxID=467358 RepID=A0A9P0DHA7_9CUCU|nr:unnamed protein product [Ceutorhynchus assimilis]
MMNDLSDAFAKKVCEERGMEAHNINAKNALHFALKITHKPVFIALLDAGANVNDVFEGETPLHIAVQRNFLEAVALLLEKGADSNKTASIYFSAEKLFSGWLNSNAQPDMDYTGDWNIHGYTPLHFAASRNNIEIVKLLLKFKANVHIVDKDGWTPLHLASDLGHKDVVKLLLDHNANVNARCNRKIVINADNPRGTNYSGRTSLHLAALCNRKDIIDILLNKGADIDAPDYRSWTALHIACYYGYFEIAQLLLDRGANMEAEGHERWRPLHEACSQGNTEIVKLLVGRGADIEATKTWGDTPLHWAIWHGHLETVKALVELGADIFVEDDKGHAAIRKAQMKDYPDIIAYLLELCWSKNSLENHIICMNHF